MHSGGWHVRRWAGDVAGELLWRTGVSHPARRHADHLTIVTFHRVLPASLRQRYPFPGLSVTPEELRFCLNHFRRHYRCLPLSEAHGRWLQPDPHAPPLLAVTFDDGTLDNHEFALPVLRDAGMRATFFVPVDAVTTGDPLWHDRAGFAVLGRGRGDPTETVVHMKRLDPIARQRTLEAMAGGSPLPPWAGMMTWDHVRALADAGHEIGSHSMSHAILPQCARTQKRHELATSRRLLERHLGRPVPTIAYPNGDVDEETERLAAEAGYALGVTTRWGTNPPGARPLALHRCDMDARRLRRASDGALHGPRLAWRLSGLHPTLRRL
jgi:peptidoglycan/xylan/chitin deacetylase (PgdA/CDA1 family)